MNPEEPEPNKPDAAEASEITESGEGETLKTEETGSGEDPAAKAKGMGLAQIVGSVLAAALGVQSSRNRERDFKQGRAVTFIVAGLVFTALFIGGIYAVVSLVLASR